MENLTLTGTVTLIHLLAVMSPGPDFIMTIKNSLTYSRKTGIWTAVGLSMGIATHIIYCIAGLAVIISKSILLFNTIKYLGAAYLVYIGIKAVLSKTSDIKITEQEKKSEISPFSAIKIGFLTNILNPKATLFFLSLFTFVVSPEAPAYMLLTLSAIMIVNTALWFMLVAIFFTQKKVRSVFNRFQGIFNKTFGGILIILGIKVATAQK